MSRTSKSDKQVLFCCNSTGDMDARDVQIKLMGVMEYLRLLKRTTPLTDGQKYVLDAVSSEYKMTLIPLQ